MIIVVVEDNRILRKREIEAIRKALKDYDYKIVEYSDFTKELNSDFIQVSRNCIVNQNNVEEYNFKDSKIKFKNGKEIDVVLKSFVEKIKF